MSLRNVRHTAFAICLAGACMVIGSCGNPGRLQISPQENQPLTTRADSIVVWKHKRIMQVFAAGKPLKTYPVSLGKVPEGPKHFEGDQKTPEGLYFIHDRNANSHYHKNLGISYPNAADIEYAAQFGKLAGSDIKIHGFPNGSGHHAEYYLTHDWTAGCIAVSNEAIDELFIHVSPRSPVLILP